MDDGVELADQISADIVALSLRVGPTEDPDRALEATTAEELARELVGPQQHQARDHASLVGDVASLSPRHLLFALGETDRVLPTDCSRQLHVRAREPRELILYPGCRHGLDQTARSIAFRPSLSREQRQEKRQVSRDESIGR
jgi:hypothetical protein